MICDGSTNDRSVWTLLLLWTGFAYIVSILCFTNNVKFIMHFQFILALTRSTVKAA